MRRTVPTAVGLTLLSLLCVGAKPAPLHPYRTIESVTRLLAQGGHAGDCDQCHTMHGSDAVAYGHALLGPDENSLCDRCHDTPWAGGSYAGATLYLGSMHGDGDGTIWPGPDPPPRTEAGAAGKCLNCHDPHGWGDASGPTPALTLAREENLCLACHDGSPASTNIAADLAKPFVHPTAIYTGRHQGATESQPADFAVSPVDHRHAECEDCHDPHVAALERPAPVTAPQLSRSNLGVSRLLVQNGLAGSTPVFTFVPGSDTLSLPREEYQLCFKCHSTWTTPPTGQTNLPLELNPANASYHPVEATGRDFGILPGAFVMGWNASSRTGCGDCHGSDFDGAPRGPHGSSYRYILKGPYEASPLNRAMASDEICFRCHSYDVYANPSAPGPVREYSRFNANALGAGRGHAEHVGTDLVPCYACHVTHGSPTRGHLIVTGRMPGMLSYTETPTGGTCEPTCHAQQSYTVNYAR